MPRDIPHRLELEGLCVEGWSRAGEATWLRVQPPGVAFDVGRGAVELSGVRDVFLSHVHLDHVLGLPFLLSRHARDGAETTRVYCPAAAVEDLRRFVAAAERLDGHAFRYELRGLEAGDGVTLTRRYRVEAFATDHVLPSLGYHLVEKRHRLAEELRGRAPAELAELRRQGIEIEEAFELDRFSYCGDTSVAVFESEPRLLRTRALAIECTYLGSDRRAEAARYKHLAFEDLEAWADRLENEDLILHHLSRRHRLADLAHRVRQSFGERPIRVHWIPDQE
ncbi:MAG: MBL fold metallo-hydrolase [Acidobacteriota bacterium]